MSEVRIALDAMGGDFFAVPNVQGAIKALEDADEAKRKLKVILCAPEDRLLASLQEASIDSTQDPEFKLDLEKWNRYRDSGALEIVTCSQVVDMDESPASALRQKKDSSLAKAFSLVKEGRADAALSAGNSGAVMAFGISSLGRLSGVKRPAILCHFPSSHGVTILLDAGANVDCTPEQLCQFGVMGQIYYQTIFNAGQVRVALMNIGEEEGKGNEVVKAAHELLKTRLPGVYQGFVEGRDLMNGKTDVIVCDGFVGNIILKTAEGVASTIKSILKQEFQRNPIWGLGAWLAKGGFSAMKAKLDYREYGAAPLIGLNGLGLVAHGSSDGKAIFNAIRIAEKYVRQGLLSRMREAFLAQTEPTGDKNGSLDSSVAFKAGEGQ